MGVCELVKDFVFNILMWVDGIVVCVFEYKIFIILGEFLSVFVVNSLCDLYYLC